MDSIKNLNKTDFKKFLQNEDLSKLKKLKLKLDDIYYNTGESEISDQRYDMLKEAIQKRDKSYIPEVGAKLRDGENRVNLPYWLGSADKITNEQDDVLQRWLAKNYCKEYVVSDKLDGVSCLYQYVDGEHKLFTRGDGIVGADISYLASSFNLPNLNDDISVRGELIIKRTTFDEKYSSDYRNPRNMVAGLVGSKTARKGLVDVEFVTYEIVQDYGDKPLIQLETLKELGFSVVNYKIVDSLSIKNLTKYLEKRKSESKYDIDGLVIYSNKKYDRNTSGNPDYMFAYKVMFDEDVHETEVYDIEWNISKWGQLKPVLIVKPVLLRDATINRVTANNAKFVLENDIGIGTIIKVTRSKDVIPYIVEIVSSTGAELPDIPYHWDKNEVNIMVDEYDQIMCVKIIAGFFEKLGIKFVSEATVTKLIEGGFDNIIKIVSASKSDLETIFKDKSATRIYENIRKGLSGVKIPTLIGASGVLGYGIGRKRVEALLLAIPTLLDDYGKKSDKILIDKIINVEGFSTLTATKIVSNLGNAKLFLEKISKYCTIKEDVRVSDELVNKKFVVSGFRDKNLEERINERGGKMTSAVSKQTMGVITNDKNSTTGKVDKARKLGIPIYTKEEFERKFLK